MLMANRQRPEPTVHGSGDELDVHSLFRTLQGEGPYAGHPAIFLRLAGCNLQCPGCDTEYTQGRRKIMRNDLVNMVADKIAEQMTTGLLVITGGEPLRQNIVPFITDFWNLTNFRIQIETNGVVCPDGLIDLVDNGMVDIVVSPKTHSIHPDIALHAIAYKYVLECNAVDPDDGLPRAALHHLARPRVARPPKDWPRWRRPGRSIYVNPMDEQDPEKNSRNMQAVVESCMTHGYIAGVQAHKLWNLP